jgi:hypothetical protein
MMVVESHLDGSVTLADVIENGATADAERDVDAKAEPVVAEVPVHVDKRPLGQHGRLRKEAWLPPFHLHHISSVKLNKSCTQAIVKVRQNSVAQPKVSECDQQWATYGALYVGNLLCHLLHVHGGLVCGHQRVDGLGGGHLLSTKTFLEILWN